MARTLDNSLLDYIRRQPAKANLNSITFLAKKELKREASDPDRTLDDLQSEFKLKEFIQKMKLEAATFRSWLSAITMFEGAAEHAEHKWRTSDAAALAEALQQAMADAWPVFASDTVTATTAQTSWATVAAAEYHEVTESAKVGFLNATYLGHVKEAEVLDIALHISGFVNSNPKQNCYILIGPNFGRFNAKRDELIKVLRAMEATLKDPEKKLEVINVTISFKPDTAYSVKTSLRQEAFLLISSQQDASYQLVSRWTKSALYLREALEEQPNFHPRADFVNPGVKLVQAKRIATGHVERELKQYVTGAGLYNPLIKTLLSGMGFRNTELITIVDDCGYDATLPKTIISMLHDPPAKMLLPKMNVITHVWNGSKDTVANTLRYCTQEIRGQLKETVKKGMPLKGYVAMPQLKSSGDPPRLDVSKFTLSVPSLAKRVLQVKKEDFQQLEQTEAAKAWLVAFNAELNPQGGFYVDQGVAISARVQQHSASYCSRKRESCLRHDEALHLLAAQLASLLAITWNMHGVQCVDGLACGGSCQYASYATIIRIRSMCDVVQRIPSHSLILARLSVLLMDLLRGMELRSLSSWTPTRRRLRKLTRSTRMTTSWRCAARRASRR